MTEKSEVIKAINSLVAKAGEILGSKLAMDLKVAVPTWSAAEFECRSLREFIVANVDDVVVAGRSGMDVVYSTTAREIAPSAVADRSGPAFDAWRAWVSPNSPFVLAVNTTNGNVLPIKKSGSVPDSHVYIEPATIEEHKSIAREFLSVENPGLAQETLRVIVDSPDEQWWHRWLAEVKKQGKLSAWNAFRNKRLHELLQGRLDRLGLDTTVQKAVINIFTQLRQSHSRKPHHTPNTRNDFRDVVTAVINKMSEEDLREMRLPVGLVIDVLDEMGS